MLRGNEDKETVTELIVQFEAHTLTHGIKTSV